MSKVKKIYQDTWFEQWFTRKDDGFLTCRFIEYAWVMRHLNLAEGSILDSGCGASYFPLMLALQGFKVTATDYNKYDYGFKYYEFVQGDSATINLGKRMFDRITMISSLEHYGIQHMKHDPNRDFKTIKNLGKYLKPNGQWMITVPFGKAKLLPSWHVYDQKRLNKLFPRIIKQEYFIREGEFWRKTTRKAIEKVEYFKGKGSPTVTCMVAKK